MKNKIIAITLGVLLVASIGLNVYQFTRNKALSVEAVSLQTDIDRLNENISSLNNEKVAKDEEISILSEKVKDLEERALTLQSDNESLIKQLEEQSKLAGKVDEDSVEPPVEKTPTVETPVEEPTEEEFKLTDEDIQVLKIMGATDSQIKAVKSQSDLDKLINLLINNGINGGGSGSGSGNNSGGRDDYDPSMDGNLGDPDDTVPGSM